MQWFNPWYLHWTMNQNGLGSLLKWQLPRHLLLGDSDSVAMSWITAVIFNKCPGDSNTASSDWCAISTGLGYLTSLLLTSIIHCFCLRFVFFLIVEAFNTYTREKNNEPLKASISLKGYQLSAFLLLNFIWETIWFLLNVAQFSNSTGSLWTLLPSRCRWVKPIPPKLEIAEFSFP